MKKRVVRIAALVLTVVMLCALIPAAHVSAAADASGVCALLDSYTAQSSYTFALNTRNSRFYVVSSTAPTGDLLQTVQLIQREYSAAGYNLSIVWGPSEWAKSGDILLHVDSAADIGAEGYALDVDRAACIKASDVDGLLYGGNMLLKIIRNCGTSIQGFKAKDVPDTKERTVQLDVARKYFTKDWICNFIRQMSWMGYNTLSLHFSEDGGFRANFWDLEYLKNDAVDFTPKNDFSWICGSQVQSWVNDPYRTDPDANKYLTTAELVEIINVAKEYHIDIIPSFDAPSHMDYLTWKFEQNYKSNNQYKFSYNDKDYEASKVNGCINYTGRTGAETPSWPYYTTIDINDDTTRGKTAQAFVFAIYEDIAEFFKAYAGSTNFSIGADEVNLTASSSITWEYGQFPGFINEINGILRNKGYTVRMYNDFIKEGSLSQFDDTIEIMYWNSPHDTVTGKAEVDDSGNPKAYLPVSTFVSDGRTMFNCIQTSTYYVLRIADGKTVSDENKGKDARDPSNTNWQFYYSTEKRIFNNWYPADISEKGNHSEDAADVPVGQLGGGYFLLWNDYCALATESEIWNGKSDGTWDAIDRMWSNTLKMWNWDIDSSVTYDDYASLRRNFGFFPGYTSCAAKTTLPAPKEVTQAYLADHTALNAAVAEKYSSAGYTAESYQVYEDAYYAAVELNKDHSATEEQINQAITALNDAIKGLVEVDVILSILYMTNVNGETRLLKQEECAVKQRNFAIYVAPINGYTVQSCDGATFTATPSRDGSGTISGSIKNPTVTLWYKNTPNTERLDYLVDNRITSQGTGAGRFTDASWTAYQTAVTNANNFAIGAATTQADIDQLVKALEQAETGLVTASDQTKIISIEKLTSATAVGKQVGLRVTTSPDVASLSVEGETLTLCVGKVQTLKNGEGVKIWLIHFPGDEMGNFTYTLTAGTASETFEVTVQ